MRLGQAGRRGRLREIVKAEQPAGPFTRTPRGGATGTLSFSQQISKESPVSKPGFDSETKQKNQMQFGSNSSAEETSNTQFFSTTLDPFPPTNFSSTQGFSSALEKIPSRTGEWGIHLARNSGNLFFPLVLCLVAKNFLDFNIFKPLWRLRFPDNGNGGHRKKQVSSSSFIDVKENNNPEAAWKIPCPPPVLSPPGYCSHRRTGTVQFQGTFWVWVMEQTEKK